MKLQIIHTENQKVIDFFREIKKHDGYLYHYTSDEKLESIKGGSELWITRSDSFLDKNEVKYGLNILKQVANDVLDAKDNSNLNKLISGFNELMINSYIFSTSFNQSSDYLCKKYGRNIIEFNHDFSISLRLMSYHSIKNGDSYRLHYFIDNYESIEGYVVYEVEKQKILAEMAVIAMSEILKQESNIVDLFHARAMLLMCISLFKYYDDYHQEEEYRIMLIRKSQSENIDFNEERADKGIYIKAIIPALHQRIITNVSNKR